MRQVLVPLESFLRSCFCTYFRLAQKLPKNRQMSIMRVMAENIRQVERTNDLRVTANQHIQATLLQARNGLMQKLKGFERFVQKARRLTCCILIKRIPPK